MNATDRIGAWFEDLEHGKQMKREDVCFLMVQARHLIEAAVPPEGYRVAAFYADWTVHSALDRSIICYSVLRDITCCLAENFHQTNVDITREISRIIGFPRLRFELIALFRENTLPIVLFDNRERWCEFVRCLLWFLAGQPISWPQAPNRKAKTIRDEGLTLQRPYNIWVEKLTIENRDHAYHWLLDVSSDKGVIKMMGQVELGEAVDAFFTPPESGSVKE